MALNNETYAPEHMLGERTRFRQWATASVLIAVNDDQLPADSGKPLITEAAMKPLR